MQDKKTRLFIRIGRLNRKWTNEILVTLFFRKKLNFNALKKDIKGVTSKILANRIKKLEKYCLIKKTEAPEKMIRWYYKLTKRGKKFVESLLDVISYGIEKDDKRKEL